MAHGLRAGLMEAQRIVQDVGIAALPVDPIEIARSHDIHVAGKDCEGGVSGMLIRNENRFAIVYATHVPSEGFKRFSIAHELGHYFMPGHPESVFRNGEVHRSQAEYATADTIEREADEFAAGLLMPSALVTKTIVGAKDGMSAVKELSRGCGTSLVASAIRYIDIARAPVAVLVSKDDHIQFCFCSDELLEFRGLTLPRARSVIPKGTLTEHYHKHPELIARAASDKGDGMLRDWLGGSSRTEVAEEVVGLGRYGRVLTVLSAASSADDDDEEGDIEERWAPPRFGR